MIIITFKTYINRRFNETLVNDMLGTVKGKDIVKLKLLVPTKDD